MKIIQSFWSLPMTESSTKVLNNRFSGGWLKPELHLLSWAYSCLQLRKFYSEVELITDNAGKYLLIDTLKLPYTSVDIELENISGCNPNLWALGKLHAFKKQNQPFLHVDGDVFVWEQFDERLANAGLVMQNEECNFLFYKEVMLQLVKARCYIPLAIMHNYENHGAINAYNAGIIGGNNLNFFQKYTTEAIRFVDYNYKLLPNLPMGQVNAFYEQHLFYCLAKQENQRVECYTSVTDEHVINQKFKSLSQFSCTPEPKNYIHLFGEDAKKDEAICAELERRMREQYPVYYERVLHIAGSI
jgi:hypothetical protein